MKTEPHFIDFVNDIKSEWEQFPKNAVSPVDEFKPTLDLIFKQHGFMWVTDEKFVDRALDAYRERLVDDFTEMGYDLQEFISSEAFVLGSNSWEHYADLFKLSTQSLPNAN